MTTKNYNVMHSAESNNHVDIYQVRDVPQNEINEAVYAALCMIAVEVLKRSSCFISGERTAAELAGTLGKYVDPVMPLSENEKYLQMAPEVRVEVGTWTCNFPTKEIFWLTAEWEGVMGLTMKQAYRFQCEAKIDAPQGLELKAYKRSRTYHGKRISYADEEKRIAERFAVIGPMSQDLNAEGMKKAMSVLVAVKQLQNIPYYYANIADEVLRRKLWNDYGKKGGMGPVPYCEKDFEYGPEIWKQVDEDYVKVLVDYFNAFMEANPAPEWVKEAGNVWAKTPCYAQFKNQESVVKKYRGKFYVEGLECSVWSDRVEWRVIIKTDRYRTEMHPESRLEPWVEPEKPTKKKVSRKSAPGGVKSEERRMKNEATPTATISAISAISAGQPTLADQLRARLAVLLAA